MVRFLALLALLLPSGVRADTARAPFAVGETVRVIHPGEPRHWRGAKTEALVTRVWYPADPGPRAEPHEIGPPGRAIFVGHALVAEAPIASGSHPLILLSHGTGGSADSLDWLGAALAEHGALVVGVNHPGNTALEALTAAGFRLWWERATDLCYALDGIFADPQLGPTADRTRIGAIGFSLGGYTVLELAGARTDVAAFEHFCASAAADAICHPPEAAALGPDFAAADRPDPATAASLARSGQSFRDPRVRAVFAIAPALGEAFDAAGLAGVAVPVALLAGDGDATVPGATNARRFAALMPGASIEILPGGVSHYTFLDRCTPAAVPAQPAICTDAPGVDRETVHRRAADLALRFFAATLDAPALQAAP